MRTDSAIFQSANRAKVKEPRFVVQIIYSLSSPSFASRSGISNIPGVEVASTVKNISSISQEVRPDEGRSTIGTISVQITDFQATTSFTEEIRDQLLNNAEGLRGRELRVYVGYSDDFNDFARVATARIDGVSVARDGSYTIRCSDIIRALRTHIFERKQTTLTASISATDTTIPVADLSGFTRITHGNSFTDAPGQTVGYFRIDDTGEVVRYTGKTASEFTGCTRGVFGTTAKPVEIDPNTPIDRRPEVDEFIYLEMPIPALMLAVMTGTIPGTFNTLPSHWHAAMADTYIRTEDFENIGLDLWDPTDESKGMIARFTDLDKTDAKTFIERELHRFQGTYSPVYTDGTIGLKRIKRVIQDAAPVATLDPSNIVQHGDLTHDLDGVINQFRIDWNWSFIREEFTRTTLFTDADSVSRHGAAEVKTLELLGLSGTRHTATTIKETINALRDRYSNPPELLQVTVLPSLNNIEVGDVVRVAMPTIKDYAGADTLDRSFEVSRAQINWQTGNVTLSLFGTTGEVEPIASGPSGSGPALADSWYTSEGTDIAGVLTVSSGVVTANGSLAGGESMNDPASVFYFDGDLEIAAGVTVTLSGNVQLRIKGFLTVNGTIDGIAGGHAGGIDTSVQDQSYWASQPVGGPWETLLFQGTSGFIGNTRGTDGVRRLNGAVGHTNTPALTLGRHSSFPVWQMEVNSGVLSPLPDDLRGTSGGPGGGIWAISNATVRKPGGQGGASGAGLAIICRGLGFGVSGQIDLSGGDGQQTTSITEVGIDWQPGSGGGGAPGALFVGLDGPDVALPDLSGGKFVANTGHSPIVGSPGIYGEFFMRWQGLPEPYTGENSAAMRISDTNLAQAAQRIQFIPPEDTANEDEDAVVPRPTNLVATGVKGGIELTWTAGADGLITEVYVSTVNDRSFATGT